MFTHNEFLIEGYEGQRVQISVMLENVSIFGGMTWVTPEGTG